MDAVKAVFAKIFFSVLGFMILFSIVSSVSEIINTVIRYMNITPELMKIIVIVNAGGSLVMFAFLAFSVAVLTAIYIQLDTDTAAAAEQSVI